MIMKSVLSNLIMVGMVALISASNWHPIHISLTNINFNKENRSLEITHRFFVDDFERRLEEEFEGQLRLGTDREHPKADRAIEGFLEQNFTILVNGKPVSRTYIGKEVEADAIWVYIEVPKIKRVKNIEVQHLALLDVFRDQRNFVNVEYEGEKKAVILHARQPKDIISF